MASCAPGGISIPHKENNIILIEHQEKMANMANMANSGIINCSNRLIPSNKKNRRTGPRSRGPTIRSRPRPSTRRKNGVASNSAMFMLEANLRNKIPSEGGGALKHRFDRLPIHKICCSQSCHPSEIVFRKLEKVAAPSRARRFLMMCNNNNRIIETGKQQDCLGMTPLHILACSTKHDLALYKLIIEKYPENLITQDGWGDIPLLYAFWGNAPQEVVHLLVEKHQSIFPTHELDWAGMVETLGRAQYLPGRASASLICIQNVLDMKQRAFPNHIVDWEKVVTNWASEDTQRATQHQAPRFHHDAFKYLIYFSIVERLNSLGVDRWRKEILSDMDELRWFVCYRKKSTDMIYSKLAHYEHMDQLREATSILELALWKESINCSVANDQESVMTSCHNEDTMNTCRIRCGADVVMPNVVSFLLPA